jgi:hypothetical protein
MAIYQYQDTIIEFPSSDELSARKGTLLPSYKVIYEDEVIYHFGSDSSVAELKITLTDLSLKDYERFRSLLLTEATLPHEELFFAKISEACQKYFTYLNERLGDSKICDYYLFFDYWDSSDGYATIPYIPASLISSQSDSAFTEHISKQYVELGKSVLINKRISHDPTSFSNFDLAATLIKSAADVLEISQYLLGEEHWAHDFIYSPLDVNIELISAFNTVGVSPFQLGIDKVVMCKSYRLSMNQNTSIEHLTDYPCIYQRDDQKTIVLTCDQKKNLLFLQALFEPADRSARMEIKKWYEKQVKRVLLFEVV